MHGRFRGGLRPGFDVELGGFGHAVAEGGDFFVGHGVEVDFASAATASGGVLEGSVHGSVESAAAAWEWC